MVSIRSLKSEGWNIDEVKLREFADESVTEKISKQELQKLLSDQDIKDYGEAFLSDAIAKSSLKGPFVIQLAKWENVSYPKISEHHQNDGVCSLILTDGFKSVKAMTTEPLSKISGETPYGVKILVTGGVNLEHGIIQLNNKNCSLIGGNVEKLVEKWKTERYSSNKDARNASEAPKWVSVGKAGGTLAANKGRDTFKAMAVAGGGEPKAVETNIEFEAARQQEIANLKEMRKNVTIPSVKLPGNQQKVSQTVTEVSNPPTQDGGYRNNSERNTSGRKERTFNDAPPPPKQDIREGGNSRNHRGNTRGSDTGFGNARPAFRGNRDNTEDIRNYITRPSATPTLFDHILTKIPDAPTHAPPENKPVNAQNNQNRYNRDGPPATQHNSNSNYRRPPDHQYQPRPQNSNITSGFSQMNMGQQNSRGSYNSNNRGNPRGRGRGRGNYGGGQRYPPPGQSFPQFVPDLSQPGAFPPFPRAPRNPAPPSGDGNTAPSSYGKRTWTSSKRQ